MTHKLSSIAPLIHLERFQDRQHRTTCNIEFQPDSTYHNERYRKRNQTSSEVAVEVSDRYAKNYGPINISGNAQVQLGDRYEANRDVFETGTPEQRRTAILNLLYYDALDLKREQLGIDDFGPASFVWVKDTGFYQWLEQGTAPFWIQGKPASGKSTLMKYLSESMSTHDTLQKQGGRWKILQFFFDHRSGKHTANHVLGLMKLFIRQLVTQIPRLAELLTDEHTRQQIAGEDASAHLNILANLIRDADIKLCAFIDGLDEYDGDPWELCNKLEALRNRTGIKLCLASRPELAFEKAYSACPGLTMQQHNLASIKLYITSKVARFCSEHTFQRHLFPDSLQSAVAGKSEGVILWARLVIDEMVKSCDDTTTVEDLVMFLESLPAEMEPLYERILEKQGVENQQEAAIVLMLVDQDVESRIESVVYQAWKFIEADCRVPAEFPQSCDDEACRSRVKALLGGLIEIITLFRPQLLPPRRFFGTWRKCNSLGQPVAVRKLRLLHKSLSTYLRRSSWLKRRLSIYVSNKYLDMAWLHLTFEVMSRAHEESIMDVESVVADFKRNQQSASQSRRQHITINHKRDDLSDTCLTLRHDEPPITALLEADMNGMCRHFTSLIKVGRWLPQTQLLWDCTMGDWCPPTTQPRFANTLTLFHILRCRQCECSRKYIVGEHLLLLYSRHLLSWLITVNHRSYRTARLQLQADKDPIDHQSLQAMFDMLIISITYRKPEHDMLVDLEQLVDHFAHKSIYIDGRHVCILGKFCSYDTLQRFLSRRPTDARLSFDHHENCPHRETNVAVPHHLVHRTNFVPLNGDEARAAIQEEFYGRLYGDVESFSYGNGKNLLHGLIHCPHYQNVYLFLYLMKAGGQVDVSGGPNDLIRYAKTRRRRVKLERLNPRSRCRSPLELDDLDVFIWILDDYRKGKFQWDDPRWGVFEFRL